jgi:hypothetical protein
MSLVRYRFGWPWALVCSLILCLVIPEPTHSKPDEDLQDDEVIQPDGIHVLDGSYVLDVGEFQINITNHGLIGSQFTDNLPYSSSPSGEWPGGSGHEYLWGAGLWVGGRINGEAAVSTGQPEREFRPGSGILDTIYEAKNGKVIRPTPNDVATGNRLPHPRADDDNDGTYDEDFLNGFDDDGDGLVDEDFGQLGDQMFTTTMHDNTALSREIYPEHKPLDISVVQHAATWYREDLENIVIFDFEIYNNGYRTLNDIYLGFYADCDIQRRDDTSTGSDDLAGFYKGAVRSSDGAFQRIQLAWMHDAARYDPLPGWVGTILLEHKTDFSGTIAPRQTEVRSFQIFATNARVNQNGEPKTDADRYQLMAEDHIDPDRRPDQPGDLKYMFSSGPFDYVQPGEKLIYRVAMVIGNSKAEMLANAVKATELARGHWFDLDNNWTTGRGGRETKVCIGDLPKGPGEPDPLFSYRAVMPNEVCAGSHPRLFIPYISTSEMFSDSEGNKCIYINADNCEECFRAVGQDCVWGDGLYDSFSSYIRRDLYPNAQIYTGYGGREGRVPWIGNEERPPTPPSMRLVPGQFHVDVYWDDSSEHEPDFLRDVIDFESYQIWRVDNWKRPQGTDIDLPPRSDLWAMINEYDVANFIPAGVGFSPNELPLGNNTGLESASYDPVCFTDPAYAGLAEAMQEFVDADPEGKFNVMPPLRNNRGVVVPGREGLVPWEASPTVLDTFFALTSRAEAPGVRAKRASRYYRHRDTEVHDGFPAYYSVVAADHALAHHENRWVPAGTGIWTEPGNNFQKTMPAPEGQTPANAEQMGMNIYVFPNPATREALAQFQQQPPSGEDPTGERIMFNNLPAAQNTIIIFTASGDVVQTIEHDGTNDGGAVTWNLMSRNGQEVVSGIYLYTVKTNDSSFEDFHGRFVLVR